MPDTSEAVPVVVFEDFGDNSLVFDLFFWCEMTPGTELRLIRSNIRFMIEELFRENGIVIAFPQRDVHLDVSGPIEVRMDNKNETTDQGLICAFDLDGKGGGRELSLKTWFRFGSG